MAKPQVYFREAFFQSVTVRKIWHVKTITNRVLAFWFISRAIDVT
jgi:hypothetical protein